MQARQWWVLVRYKNEAGAGFGRQYVAATNAYEAIQMEEALYGRQFISDRATRITPQPQTCILFYRYTRNPTNSRAIVVIPQRTSVAY